MNCVNSAQQLKGFCLIYDQDNFNIKISTAKEEVLTTKDRTEQNLNSCYYMKGVQNLQSVIIAPTRNHRLLDADEEEEAEIVLSSIDNLFTRWPETEL